LRLLGEVPLTVGEIVEVTGLPQSTVSRQLKILRDTGLLVDFKEGPRVITGLAEPNGNGELQLSDMINQWVRGQPLPKLLSDRLARVLEGRKGEGDKFERLAYQWDELRRQYFGSQFHLEALCSLLPSEWHVLDVGTGTGYLLPALSRIFQHVTAVDPSPAMLRLARQRADKEGIKNVIFKYGRLESIPQEAETIDAALAILVLHHATDYGVALGELHRVLKPEAYLLVVDLFPHSNEDFQREMGDPVSGIHPEELTGWMEQAGFSVTLWRHLAPGEESVSGPIKSAPDMYLIKANKK